MANKYVQYGAAIGTGIAATGIAAGVKAYGAGALAPVYSVGAGGGQVLLEAGRTTAQAMDAATSAAGSAITGITQNPQFLMSVGLGLAGLALGSGASRPSLSFPNLAASAAVALNVNNLLQQGKAAAASFAQSRAGVDITSRIGPPVQLRSPAIVDTVNLQRQARRTYRLTYPEDLTDSYYIRFSLSRYERLNKASRELQNGLAHTSIQLPLPNNLVDSINLAYQDVGLGVFGGPAFNNIMGNLNASGGPSVSGASSAQEILRYGKAGVKGFVDTLKEPQFAVAVARRLASNIDPGLGTIFDLATGTAPNPHMSVSFQGVSLKRYQFTWRASPNTQKESEILDKIIRNLQASALPTKQNSFMLGFPDVVKVEMSPTNLFQFKPMMIDNVVVNYAPSGTPSFFKGGPDSERYPTEVEFTISLREIDIHTASDDYFKNIRNDQDISDPAASSEPATSRTAAAIRTTRTGN